MKTFSYMSKVALGFLLILSLFVMGSCTKENIGDNGLKTDLQPSFSITPVTGKTNTYVLKNTTPGAMGTQWDYGKGGGFISGTMIDTVFFPDAGTYSINMQVMGKGGIFYDAAAQTVDVATSDPAFGNMVQGGRFGTGDEAKWTMHHITAGVSTTVNDGKLVFSGGNGGHAAIYQAIEVEANKKYRFSMIVSGSGATDTWFEVYFGTDAPIANFDYSSGGKRWSLNTWAGCGKTPFNGNLAEIGCDGSLSGNNGEITFSETGTVYLFIKSGGANLGTSGISVDNVELRGT